MKKKKKITIQIIMYIEPNLGGRDGGKRGELEDALMVLVRPLNY